MNFCKQNMAKRKELETVLRLDRDAWPYALLLPKQQYDSTVHRASIRLQTLDQLVSSASTSRQLFPLIQCVYFLAFDIP